MTITARFASICPCCQTRIIAGSQVEWSRGSPARHVSCSPALAQAPRTVRAANSRCHNPRDCGDPTCDGDCGY
jgi:hypothetical protein